MPRKPRVEYEGAVYHVMSRGNHLQEVFRGDEDCGVFLETIGEACGRTGWIKERLKMGTATGFAAFLGRLERARRGEWGYAQWSKVKGLARKAGRP
jgi:hypothetical protein